MIAILQLRLLAIAAAVIGLDVAWAGLGHFHADGWAYARIALLSLLLAGGGLFYQYRRGEPRLAAMLLGTAFLCAFSAAASLLNYLLLTFHGPRIDTALAAADRALGFDWVAMMTAMAAHPGLNRLLFYAYGSVLPQVALMVILLARIQACEKVYRFLLAVAAGALIAIAAWAVAPSFGAMSVHALPGWVAARVPASVDSAYGAALIRMLSDGPGFLAPSDMRGLIGFPSYHAVLALILAWHARGLGRLFWPLLVLNLLVLASTPVQGGHHLMDVLAAFPVAALALAFAGRRAEPRAAAKARDVVNGVRIFTITPVP